MENPTFEEDFYMKLSNETVLKFHDAILSALKEDDALPPDGKKYGVRHYSDWRRQCNAIESAMLKRKIPFTPAKW